MPGLISQRELDDLRALQTANLPSTGTLQIYSQAADGYGGFSETWVNAPSTIACRIGVPTGHELQLVSDMLAQSQTGYTLTTAWNVNLKRRDRIQADDSRIYEVLSDLNPPDTSYNTVNRWLVGRHA